MKQQKIMEQQTPITLDERINQDLAELYNILHKSVPLKAIKGVGGISAAVELSEKLYSGDKHEDDDAYELSTLGLPGYFTGNRDAKTVTVMLNPGISAMENDNPLKTMKSIKELGIDFDKGEDKFIDSYKEKYSKFGEHESYKVGAFDLKQAVFLSAWENTGIKATDGFPQKLIDNSGKHNNAAVITEIKSLKEKATGKVLTQKLQLELIPYASRKFDTHNANLEVLMPYLETLLHEIFNADRKYIIFCSNFFERLFKAYSKKKNKCFEIVIDKKNPASECESVDVHCTLVKITYNGQTKPAIIAHTFSNQSLTNAYEKMQKYGKQCYKNLNPYLSKENQ